MPQGNSNYPYRRVPPQGTFPSGDPRWVRKQAAVLGGNKLPALPFVTTVGVNSITENSANIIGAINPNGTQTSWWIAYDTQLPLSPGVTTTPASIGNGTSPVTVIQTLSGLVTGLTYYFAVVGQSGGGTVYGQTLSFVAAAPATTISQPVSPFGTPIVTIPHFEFPFSLVGSPDGTVSGVAVVDQDTLEEVVANVGVVMSCPVGACPQLPTFGCPTPTFAIAPLDTTAIATAIQLYEPRATVDIVTQLLPDGTSWGMNLMTSATASQDV